MEGPSEGLYRVVLSRRIREQLRRWGEQAAARGIESEYLDVLRTTSQRLTTAPLDWGDPLYRLPALNVQVYRGLTSIFYVYYAVDQANRIVYPSEFKLLPSHPLGQDG